MHKTFQPWKNSEALILGLPFTTFVASKNVSNRLIALTEVIKKDWMLVEKAHSKLSVKNM